MYKIGDIVLVPFPFTDLSGNKVQPALVLGTLPQQGDLTVCFISSVPLDKQHKFDVLIGPQDKNFPKTGLKLKSVIKVTKLATLDKTIFIGQIGQLDLEMLTKVQDVLKAYFKF